MNEDQIRLEMKITHVEQLVAELNGVIYEQQKDIDRLRARLVQVDERLNAGAAPMPANQKPPHY